MFQNDTATNENASGLLENKEIHTIENVYWKEFVAV